MASISFKITGIEDLKRMADALGPAVLAKAQKGGVRYASDAAKTLIAKEVGAAYNLKAARIKGDIKGPTFSSDGTIGSLRLSRKPPTLTQFGAKPGRRGHQAGLGRGLGWAKPKPAGRPLTALILRSNGRKAVPGAFQIIGNNGNLVTVKRASGGKLKPLYGPSVGSIFAGRSRIAPQLQADLQIRINQQFIKGFERVLSSAMRGYGPKV